jgi:mannose-6-phosphate isomerase
MSEGVSDLRPIVLGDNRVPVYYAGGDNIDDFRGAPGRRSGPEDWVGSTAALPAAILGPTFPPETGVSRLPQGQSLRDAVSSDPVGWLGPEHADALGGETALLVKLLDAGERLPVHCHPTRPFARRHLDSFFGKTEGWIIMRSAPGAGVWLGMRDTVERGDWQRWTADQDVEAMLGAMNRFAVEPGDVVYVPAGLPHAIGPGVMLTELQEPTSFSVLAEHVTFGLDDDRATLGLGWDVAIDCFDLGGYARRLDDLVLRAAGSVRGDGVRRLFPERADGFFRAELATCGGALARVDAGFAVLVVASGRGEMRWDGGVEDIVRGQTWIVPHAAGPLSFSAAELQVIVCRPPDPGVIGW